MCGIAGVWGEDQDAVATAAAALVREQRHRGPDDEGIQRVEAPGALVLGHRRLAILDLSPNGHQPMRSMETGDWVVFNGEIYNFAAVKESLTKVGVSFSTRSDTEVLLKAFGQWGTDAFLRLEGMYAVGLFSARERRLYLARDPLGIKPLYLSLNPRGLAFASEARALAKAHWVSGEVDRRALAGLLAYGAVQSPLVLWKGIEALDPGTWRSFHFEGGVREVARRRFWDFPAPTRSMSWDDARAELRERLVSAVRGHLLSDVPVGVFLSSGLDSNAVAGVASKLRQGNIDTFTVGAAEAGAQDERGLARQAAASLGSKHHDILLGPDQMLGLAQAWLESADQPSLDGLNTFIISNAVKERGVVVVLSGLGGDELFGGYSTFREVPRLLRWARRLGPIPSKWRARGARALLWRSSPTQKRKATELLAAPRTLSSFYFRRRRLLSDAELAALGVDPLELDLDGDALPPECQRERALPTDDDEAAIRVLESRFYMGNMLLRDSDIFSMAHGLELRVPLLDTPLASLAFSLPGTFTAPRRGQSKPLLAEALQELLPTQVLRRPKQGFVLPYAAWMTGPLREWFEGSWASLEKSGLLHADAVRAVKAELLAQPRGPAWSRAWLLGVLGNWVAGAQWG